MRISDWSSDVCSSDLPDDDAEDGQEPAQQMAPDRSQREDEGGAQHQGALTRSPCRWRVSTLSTSPSLKLTIVCANAAMSGSWVTISTVIPLVWLRSVSNSMISTERSESRLPVGSSASSTSGWVTIARAIADRKSTRLNSRH